MSSTSLSCRLSFAAIILFCLAQNANAASQTFKISGGFTGGELGVVAYDFTVTHDFSTDTENNSKDITVSSFNSSVLPGNPIALTDPSNHSKIGFDYSVAVDVLMLGGGGVNTTRSTYTDFVFVIDNFISAPTIRGFRDSIEGATSGFGFGTSQSFQVTEITAPIPLPASAFFLLGALGCMALRGREVSAV